MGTAPGCSTKNCLSSRRSNEVKSDVIQSEEQQFEHKRARREKHQQKGNKFQVLEVPTLHKQAIQINRLAKHKKKRKPNGKKKKGKANKRGNKAILIARTPIITAQCPVPTEQFPKKLDEIINLLSNCQNCKDYVLFIQTSRITGYCNTAEVDPWDQMVGRGGSNLTRTSMGAQLWSPQCGDKSILPPQPDRLWLKSKHSGLGGFPS